jgi:3-deoxy-D-manno-octulosonic-acid transferase
MLPRLYRAATWPLAPLALVYLKRRCKQGKEDALRLRERQGVPGAVRPQAALVWIHAASVGEATAMLALIERLLETRPTLEILVTTGTVTSARLLEGRLPARAHHQFVPADLPRWVARFLDHWRPDLAIWVESELWPNLVLATPGRGIPMALVNARLSARSFARWQRWPRLIGPMLGAFSLCLAQDEEQAGRFRRLGAREVGVVGDLKATAAALPVDRRQLTELAGRIKERPRWLAASTHAGEEEIAARVHHQVSVNHPGLLTIIVPRHPARGDALQEMLTARGLSVARRSHSEPITGQTDVYLGDTMGELGLFYRLAGIAFVGGSLVAKGGHNPFEAARLGCAVLLGLDTRNCANLALELTAAGAAETVSDPDELARAVAALLDDPPLRTKRAAAGRRVADAGPGILEAVLERLAPWLDVLAPERSFVEPPRSLRA